MTGLYIHIPYCRKRCHYCNFVISTHHEATDIALFVLSLEKECDYYLNTYGRQTIHSLYFGGGTPSLLSIDPMRAIFRTLRRTFDWSSNIEVTMEVNPEDVCMEKAAFYRDSGVNRISMGAQSFSDRLLKHANRSHDSQRTHEAYNLLRQRASFDNISMDLILNLPSQSREEFEKDIESLISMRPEHISMYELCIEPKTYYERLYKQGLLPTVDEDKQKDRLLTARKSFENHEYCHYELLSFSRPGYESQHNRLYWTGHDYIGLGPGAWSYLSGTRSCRSESVSRYIKKMNANDFSNEISETLDDAQAKRESLVLALRLLKEGVGASLYEAVGSSATQVIEKHIKDGFLVRRDQRLYLSSQGTLYAESIFSSLI